MRLERVVQFLETCDGATDSSGSNIRIRCPFCGGSAKDSNSMSVKLDIGSREPMLYSCFRMSCGQSGMLNTSVLQLLGCTDQTVLMELANHNRNVGPRVESPFHEKQDRGYVTVNLPIPENRAKAAYIQNRLGVKLTMAQLGDLKIQLSLSEMLRVNGVAARSAGEGRIRSLDANCIGFVSMYGDYLICRDITPDTVTGNRYYNYRLSGKRDNEDLKIYCIPRNIDLMDPKSAVVNVAEGAFSILGAYLNTDLGAERPNNVWLANCGSQYQNTILRVCKQYGLLKCRINIWSDSEVPVGKYRNLYESLRNRLDIRRFTVYYNDTAEDFGHAQRDISIRSVILKGSD